MTVFIWVLQIVLVAMFAMAGVSKVAQPKERLAAKLPWVQTIGPGQ